MQRANFGERFGYQLVKNHHHTGKDSPQIKAENVIPALSAAGSITFGRTVVYTINLNGNFTPRNILAYGTVTNSSVSASVTRRCQTVGSAQLGPAFNYQPNGNSSVVTGGPQYPFPTLQPDGSSPSVPVQGSSFLSVGPAGAIYSGVSEHHIVDIFDGSAISDIQARVTVVDFSKNYIKLYVPYLTSGWRIYVNYVVS